MRVFILGSSGMLGSVLYNYLADYYQVFGASRNNKFGDYSCDLRDQVKLEKILNFVKPDVIINAAAITDLTYCQKNIYEALSVHYELPKFLSGRNERVIQISTDSVFDGKSSNYSESDLPNPVNCYSFTKLLGEYPILSKLNGLVLRTNIYGFNTYSPGSSLFEWIVHSLEENLTIHGYRNVFFNPVSIFKLSEIIHHSIENETNGLMHIGSNTVLCKADFISKIIAIVKPSYSSYFDSIQMESDLIRPKNTSLNVEKMIANNFVEIDLDFDLRQTISNYLNQVI
jgi:dTDP-4-dehydrorhamnose reductase